MPRHVRAGDTVIVTSGDHKGKTGEVVRVIPDKHQVIVKGVNLRTKHLRPTQANPKGGVVQREAPIHISNVSPVVDGKPTRVRFETGADGKKKRIAARTGQPIPTSARKRKGERVRTDTL
ncbi:MAG: 50S ribosomal protein L24 [Phycisphaerales bacterium]